MKNSRQCGIRAGLAVPVVALARLWSRWRAFGAHSINNHGYRLIQLHSCCLDVPRNNLESKSVGESSRASYDGLGALDVEPTAAARARRVERADERLVRK